MAERSREDDRRHRALSWQIGHLFRVKRLPNFRAWVFPKPAPTRRELASLDDDFRRAARNVVTLE